MDAVEVARQRAAALHAEVVAKGADPWLSYDLACAVAQALKLDVEPVKPGSVGLKGGRAVFDPMARAIQHESTANPFHNAFLIGHELGHASLGDDQVEDVVENPDPARSAEATPVGEDRVVDYNRRQRREVLMDLFGRELLMPRPWLRRLHLGGLTASAIADRLGAPFDVVAQQLLDALLLPAVQLTEAEAAPEKPLNEAQLEAARHFGGAYLLEAGPGTGKTQTLVGRTRFLVEEKSVDPREILVLTYSNKAAGELSDRIAAQRPDAAAAMFIGTFHAFGLDLVKRFHKELGFSAPPRMMDRPEAIELLEAEFTRLELVHYRNLWDPSELLRDLLGAMSRAQDELVDASQYAFLAKAMAKAATNAEELEAAGKAAEVAKAYDAYEKIKAKFEAIDFGDLVTLPVKLLTEHPEIAAQLRETYKHVLVDEYQDVNRASVRLLQLITEQGQNLWAVGDARQAIYRFRGASSFNMARFKDKDFPGAGSRLKVNYRSVEEIVDCYSAFGPAMTAGTTAADLCAHRGPQGQKPSHIQFPTGDDEAASLAEILRENRASGRAWRDQAVLCKGNDRLARTGEALERAGIPVLFLGSLFERPEIKDLLAWLSLLIDRRAMGLVRRKAAHLDAPLSDVAVLLAHLKANAQTSLAWMNSVGAPALSPAGDEAVARMAAALNGFTSDAQPWEVLARLLLDRTRLAAEIAETEDVASRTRGLAIWQFMNFVRVQKPAKGLPIQRLLERIRRLVLLADDRDLRQLPLAAQQIDAVRLMTIHGSKGLEFPVVHILGLNKNSFPRTGGPAKLCPPPTGMIVGAVGSGRDVTTASETEEQECLFYVALSRARDQLFLYSAQANAGSGGKTGARRDPSPYLARLGPLTVRQMASAPSQPAEDMIPIAITFDGTLRFSDAQIALYEKCPRRFFYTHILEIGGKRTATAFMGMHDVVQNAIKVLAARPPEDADDVIVAEVFAELFDNHEIAGHGYAADFRTIGAKLVDYFADRRRGKTIVDPKPMRLTVAGGEILVTPDEILFDGIGHSVRSIRSGHLRTSERNNLGAAAFQLAAMEAFPGCRVELVHLADGAETPLDMTEKKLTPRRAKVEAALANIAAGRFPMDESPFKCPRCPAFFICGPVVNGTFQKKF